MSRCQLCDKEINGGTLKCKHIFCGDCLLSHFGKSKFNQYKCPQCEEELSDWAIRKVLNKLQYQQFKDKIFKNKDSSQSNCKWACTECTFINLPYFLFCNVCQSNRPEGYRPPKYYNATEEENETIEIHKRILEEEERKMVEEKVPEIQKPKCGWGCIDCTFLNLPYLPFCTVCHSIRPGNYQPPDNYKPTPEEKEAIDLHNKILEEENKRKKEEEREREERLDSLKKVTKEDISFTTEESECPVCMLDCEPGGAIILHSCLHTICRDCFKNYLLNTDNPKIKCPTENCIGQIEDKEIMAVLNAEEYKKYEQLSLRTAEATTSSSFHCKAVNCTAWIVHDGFLKNFRCPLCKEENCIECDAIHKNTNCETYKRSKSATKNSADDLFFENLLRSGEAMLCSGCKVIVEKDKGCDWIRCKMCRTELCWATKGPRWGPKGTGDTSGGCGCQPGIKKCHPSCRYCH